MSYKKVIEKNISIFGKNCSEILIEAMSILERKGYVTERIIVSVDFGMHIRIEPLFDLVTMKESMQQFGYIANFCGARIIMLSGIDRNTFKLYTSKEEDKGVEATFHMEPFVVDKTILVELRS